jgi:hypothetical protein
MPGMQPLRQLAGRLEGPPPALPGVLDRASEWWWSLPARTRLVLVLIAVVAVTGVGEWRIQQARQRWGGPPRQALIAVDDAHAGQQPQLRAVMLPPAMVPDGAPRRVDDDARLALALPRGAVLTRSHLSPRGPAAGLDPELRVVPIPVDPAWDVRPGVRVDVWVLDAAPARSQRVAAGRPVVAVTGPDDGDRSALVGLAATEVADAMRGLADGRVLLTQAPP